MSVSSSPPKPPGTHSRFRQDDGNWLYSGQWDLLIFEKGVLMRRNIDGPLIDQDMLVRATQALFHDQGKVTYQQDGSSEESQQWLSTSDVRTIKTLIESGRCKVSLDIDPNYFEEKPAGGWQQRLFKELNPTPALQKILADCGIAKNTIHCIEDLPPAGKNREERLEHRERTSAVKTFISPPSMTVFR